MLPGIGELTGGRGDEVLGLWQLWGGGGWVGMGWDERSLRVS